MKQQTYAPPSTTPEFAGAPTEWLQELHAYPEGTPQHAEILETLRALALEGLVNNPHEVESERGGAEGDVVPNGFNSVNKLPGTLSLSTKNMREKIKPLANAEDNLELNVTEYITDVGNRVLVADIRDLMSPKTRKLAPGVSDQKQLDARFLQDIKILADNNRPRNIVSGISGVGYSKPQSTLLRGYWLIETSPEGNRDPLVIRLADSAGKENEAALYRQLFDMTLRV